MAAVRSTPIRTSTARTSATRTHRPAAPARHHRTVGATALADDRTGRLGVLSTAAGRALPSLAAECPQVQLFERELAEQAGVEATGHPWPKPVRFERGPRSIDVPEGSATEQAAALLPQSRIVGAFHNLAAEALADVTRPVDGDVLVVDRKSTRLNSSHRT